MGERAKLHLQLPIAPHRSHYHLKPPSSMEKLSSMKLVPGTKKAGTAELSNSWLILLKDRDKYITPKLR